MKKARIKPISVKQMEELGRRFQLRYELLRECHGKCMTCKRFPDWRGLSLSHIIPLSRGGKTDRKNCLMEDYNCHFRYEKRPELREQEHPELFEKHSELREDK